MWYSVARKTGGIAPAVSTGAAVILQGEREMGNRMCCGLYIKMGQKIIYQQFLEWEEIKYIG